SDELSADAGNLLAFEQVAERDHRASHDGRQTGQLALQLLTQCGVDLLRAARRGVVALVDDRGERLPLLLEAVWTGAGLVGVDVDELPLNRFELLLQVLGGGLHRRVVGRALSPLLDLITYATEPVDRRVRLGLPFTNSPRQL